MKKKSNRIIMINEFIEDKWISVHIRKIVKHTLNISQTPIGINKINKYFRRLIGVTAPGKRVFDIVEQ